MDQHGKHRPLVKGAIITGFSVLASPADACRLALLLALDISASVDAEEDQLQRQGLAAALLAPEIRAAFLSSPEPVALAAFEWSGTRYQTDILDWTLITDAAALEQAAARIASSSRSSEGWPTALGYALGYAALTLQEAPECLFQTIDVAGDGRNNDGFGPDSAYAAYPFDGVIVNGLVILEDEDGVRRYYEDAVKRGPGAFVETANGFADFEAAMRRKLLRELTSQVLGRSVRGEALGG